MPKAVDEPLVAIQLRLYEKDLLFLRQYYGQSVGVNDAIRNLIRSFVKHTQAKADAMIDATENQTGP